MSQLLKGNPDAASLRDLAGSLALGKDPKANVLTGNEFLEAHLPELVVLAGAMNASFRKAGKARYTLKSEFTSRARNDVDWMRYHAWANVSHNLYEETTEPRYIRIFVLRPPLEGPDADIQNKKRVGGVHITVIFPRASEPHLQAYNLAYDEPTITGTDCVASPTDAYARTLQRLRLWLMAEFDEETRLKIRDFTASALRTYRQLQHDFKAV